MLVRWRDGAYVAAVAMRLGIRPEAVAVRLAEMPGIKDVTVTGPGFLTISVTEPGAVAQDIVDGGDSGQAPPLPPGPCGTWPDRPRTFDNPGFRVRYAYARAAAVGRRARDLGILPARPEQPYRPSELCLLGLLTELPGRARQAVRERDATPYRRHLERVADAYHDVYERCPALPKGDEPLTERHGVRLTLTEAVRIVLNNGLRVLGEIPAERV
jgi:arginyl-tRNA synthetase